MSHGQNRFPTHHGYGEVKVSRYLVLYIAQLGWVMLGVHLFAITMWPSACSPNDLLQVVTCSIQLPEMGGWQQAALFTWLWTTPLLLALEISRRISRARN